MPEGERAARRAKTTLQVENAKLSELARESAQHAEPRAFGSDKMQNIGNDARPTTQMDPSELRSLLGTGTRQMDPTELRGLLGSTQSPEALAGDTPVEPAGMRPLTKPPERAESAGEIVELGADDRKSRPELAPAKSRISMMALVLVAVVALAAIGAVSAWLH